jgi:hypothetical protein
MMRIGVRDRDDPLDLVRGDSLGRRSILHGGATMAAAALDRKKTFVSTTWITKREPCAADCLTR